MAGPLDFLSYFLPNQQAVQEYNPFAQAAPISDSVNKLTMQAVQADPVGYRNEAIKVSLINGLLSGIFGGLAQQRNSELTNNYINAVSGLTSGQPVTAESSGLPEGLFGSARQGATVFNLQKKLENDETAKKLAGAVVLENAKNGVSSSPDLVKLAGLESLLKPNVQAPNPNAGGATTEFQSPVGAGDLPVTSGPSDQMVDLFGTKYTDKDKEMMGIPKELWGSVNNEKDLRLYYQGLNIKDVQDRHQANLDFRKSQQERADEQLEFFGYSKPKIRPTASEAAKVRDELGKNEQLRNTLESLGSNIDENGFMEIFGKNAQLQDALRSFIFNTQRKATGSGARLEGPEAAMLSAMTPMVAANNFTGAIKAALLGRDPAQLARDMVNLINKSEASMMKKRFGAEPIDISTPVISAPLGSKPTRSQLEAQGYRFDPATGTMIPPGNGGSTAGW